jgi:hypothetical protein
MSGIGRRGTGPTFATKLPFPRLVAVLSYSTPVAGPLPAAFGARRAEEGLLEEEGVEEEGCVRSTAVKRIRLPGHLLTACHFAKHGWSNADRPRNPECGRAKGPESERWRGDRSERKSKRETRSTRAGNAQREPRFAHLNRHASKFVEGLSSVWVDARSGPRPTTGRRLRCHGAHHMTVLPF